MNFNIQIKFIECLNLQCEFDRERDRLLKRWAYREIERQTDRWEMVRDGQTDMQRDKQTEIGRQTKTKSEGQNIKSAV